MFVLSVTIDREIFTLKISCLKKFLVKFSRFCLIHKIFLMVGDCNMDKCLASSWCSVYYRYQKSQGSLAVVVDRTFTSGGVELCVQAFSLIIAV